MGKVHQIGNIIIRVYANDHLPPHFHVIAPDIEALVEIRTLAVLRGALPRTGGRSAGLGRGPSCGTRRGVEPYQLPLSDRLRTDAMNTTLPRIAAVSVEKPSALRITWVGGESDRAELAGWIATGGRALAPLNDQGLFAAAYVDDYGTAIAWDNGDLAIDAVHLEQLAAEQRPFGARDAARWQEVMSLSDQEAADLLHVEPEIWRGYKGGRPIPEIVGMLCRAAQRDPLLMQAHFRPRRAS